VDDALPDGLPFGVVWIQYRDWITATLSRVFGKEALDRVRAGLCHLHVQVDGPLISCPGCGPTRATATTVDIGGMPPGEHKVVD
jgi:hypothetical protein